MPAMLLQFIGSKLGGWAAAGLIAVVLGGWLYVRGLQLEACESRVEAIQSQLDTAVDVNRRNADEIRDLTASKASAEGARAAAVAIAAERKVEVVTRTNTIIKEVERATAQHECPVAPSLRAALVGLRDFGAKGRNRDGVPGREAPATGAPVRLRPASPAAQP